MAAARHHALAFVAGLVALLAFAGGAQAGTYDVQFCDGPGEWTLGVTPLPLPTGPAWRTQASGAAAPPDSHGYTFWGSPPFRRPTLACLTFPNSRTSYFGVGGVVSYSAAGSSALATFTPPGGTRIVRLAGREYGGGSKTTLLGVFAWTGRPLDEPNRTTTEYAADVWGPIDFGPDELGDDGAAGLAFGVRCSDEPVNNGVGCSGLYGFGGALTIADDSPPEVTFTAEIRGDDVQFEWSAADQQSGIANVVIRRGSDVIARVDGACAQGSAPRCGVDLRGTARNSIGPGDDQRYELVTTSAAGDVVTRAIAVTDLRPRPTPTRTPASTEPPASTPIASPSASPAPVSAPFAITASRVTITVRRKPRSLMLSGAAMGCTSVDLRIPGPRRLAVPVRGGAWQTTVRTRMGRYVARCGASSARWVNARD